MRKKTILLITLILIFCIVTTVDIFYRHYLSVLVKDRIEASLKKQKNLKLEIETVELKFPFKIQLRNIFINSPGWTFNCDKVYFNLSPESLFYGKGSASITKISIHSPHIYITDRSIFSRKDGINLFSLFPVFTDKVVINWEKGDLKLPDFNLDDTEGAVILKKNVVFLNFKKGKLWSRISGIEKSPVEDNILANLKYDFIDNFISGNIKLRNFEIAYIDSLISSYKNGWKRSLPFKGKGDFNITFSGLVSRPKVEVFYSLKDIFLKNVQFETRGYCIYFSENYKINGNFIFKDVSKQGEYNVLIDSSKDSIRGNIYFPGIDTSLIEKITEKKLSLRGILNCNVDFSGNMKGQEFIVEISGDKIKYSGELLPKEWSDFKGKFHIISNTNEYRYKVEKLKINSEQNGAVILKSNDWCSAVKDKKGNIMEGEIKLNLEFQDYILQNLNLLGRLDLYGNWENSNKDLKTDINIKIEKMWLNQYRVNNTSFKVLYHSIGTNKNIVFLPLDGDYKVDAEVNIYNNTLDISRFNVKYRDKGSISVTGRITPSETSMSIKGDRISADTIVTLINLKVPFYGISDFTFVLNKSMTSPFISGMLNIVDGSLYGLPFSNLNISFNYENGVFNVETIRLIEVENKKEKYVLSGKGTIPVGEKLKKNTPLEFHLAMEKGDFSIIEKFTGEYVKSARGHFSGNIDIGGTISEPDYSGFIKISGGNFYGKHLVSPVENMETEIVFLNNKLEIKNFSFNIGKTKVKSEGYISFAPVTVRINQEEMDLNLFNVDEYNLKIYTEGKKGVKIYLPEFPIPVSLIFRKERQVENPSYGEFSCLFELKGKKKNTVLNGFVKVDNSHFTFPPAKPLEKDELFSKLFGDINLNLELKAGKNAWFDNDRMSVNIKGGIKIEGKVSEPIVNGKIESVRGDVNYAGKIYKIKELIFEVVNNEMFIQMDAETNVNYITKTDPARLFKKQPDIGATGITGEERKSGILRMFIPRSRFGELKPIFRAREELNLSQDEAEIIMFGFNEDITPEERQFYLRQQVVRLIDSTLNSPVAQSILRTTGLIDSIQAGYADEEKLLSERKKAFTLTDVVSGMQYSFNRYIFENLVLSYILTFQSRVVESRINAFSVNAFDLKHEIQIAWRLKNDIMIRYINEIQGRDTTIPAERKIMIEPYWKFGWDEVEKKENL